jgi:hypothetical protein
VLDNDHWIADIKTYRRAYSLLSPPHNFKKILMVFDGGRVDALAEITSGSVSKRPTLTQGRGVR